MNNISWYNTNESSFIEMKYSIGEKQVKVFIMKKFLIVIFAMVGMMVIWIAFMVYSYQRSYNEWQNSHSGSKVTYPVQEYSSSNSSTKYYDYKNSNKSTDAYVKALFLSENSHLSKQKIEQDLTRWFSEDACQYAMNKLNIDWKEQAVLKAKSLQMFHFSKEMLVSQLINVELFTQEEADYAIEQVNFDWKEEAVKKVEAIANPGNMSKEELLELLVKKRKFTQEEAEYAIEHAQVDWLN